MTPEQLKTSILKYAMQGKLVEQRPEEGTGEELYCSIVFTEKKSLKPISDDEMPFDIPLSWKWLRHNELFEIIGGSQPPKSKFETIQEKDMCVYIKFAIMGKNQFQFLCHETWFQSLRKKVIFFLRDMELQ